MKRMSVIPFTFLLLSESVNMHSQASIHPPANQATIFYATDRGSVESNPPATHYGADRRPRYSSLEFGDYTTGNAGQLTGIRPNGDQVSFFDAIANHVQNSLTHDVLIFIHGFNTTFEEAAVRTAQLAREMDFTGTPILYSWPSFGGLAEYAFDEDSAEWTTPHLRRFLQLVRKYSGAMKINLIAHSMGNRALGKALQELEAEVKPLFNEVIMAAPDVDNDLFEQMAEEWEGKAKRITLYASSHDFALAASKHFHADHYRAGESDEMLVVKGVDSIDASGAQSDRLGHGYLFRASVLADIAKLIRTDDSPGQRSLRPAKAEGGQYWVLAGS